MSTCKTVIKKTGKECGRTNCHYHKKPVVEEQVIEQLVVSLEKVTMNVAEGTVHSENDLKEIIKKDHSKLQEVKDSQSGKFYIRNVYSGNIYEIQGDDDCIDILINGEQHAVTTRRGLIYKCSDKDGDILVGFSGHGKYENIIEESGKWKSEYTL